MNIRENRAGKLLRDCGLPGSARYPALRAKGVKPVAGATAFLNARKRALSVAVPMAVGPGLA